MPIPISTSTIYQNDLSKIPTITAQKKNFNENFKTLQIHYTQKERRQQGCSNAKSFRFDSFRRQCIKNNKKKKKYLFKKKKRKPETGTASRIDPSIGVLRQSRERDGDVAGCAVISGRESKRNLISGCESTGNIVRPVRWRSAHIGLVCTFRFVSPPLPRNLIVIQVFVSLGRGVLQVAS